MNVRELIDLLSKLEPNARVVTPAFESGFENIEHVRCKVLFPRKNPQWWDGDFNEDDSWNTEGEEVVMIYGTYRK
ncbi:hypothetical protein I5S53_12010 [Pseudomonas juntendi]|uniref:hypothetical protein n=1 Tax=Pseudomonas juntendi TaxID=2666183 RepID=UPI0018D7356B|nr:hypothetical protein [Pseudomonas juntendi]MBH3384685.1 hypothetical protein [Pseudomonas juntendi]MDG9917850.1 hypothetical protein [Pseudomonas juntendi]MDH0506313.1 hypothetical protein [Pseudomonas juntendi]MDH1044565.1 hypothetical protein [Pseudomonas juntendi]